ncbi:MAG: pentapeptide repeat-containing protein [Leptolyngbya sp. UWPOB_LEPTO1]|uniref:pentapeptide repeat-containing protein n=1 Tax=Leptolyngbya sp. UWPOB_LEPTO1 TaxID=2815653 RepID=UPI001AC19AA2|nr:pentapeptide repeat-containing protein [Leptolyngbya sp. UWPOB_LEPTO1]MBN8561093.1 pentapeptide repeat-containing protein [Leptolyngbya sp. UWPOB_LEPTO1]
MTQQKPPESTNNQYSQPEPPSFVQLREQSSPLQKFWNWTGFKERKLWDVLQLLIVPTALAIGAFYLQETSKQRDLEIAQANREKDQQIADDRAKQEVLNRYFDQISTLLFESQLRTARQGDEVRTVARAKTLAALRHLDRDRKSDLIRFLWESKLIDVKNSVISLESADLTGIDLAGTILSRVNLSRTNLSGAKLNDSNLTGANLAGANLDNADLSGSNLTDANLRVDLDSVVSEKSPRGEVLRGVQRAVQHSENKQSGSIQIIFPGANLTDAFLCQTTMPNGTKSDRDCDKLKPKK